MESTQQILSQPDEISRQELFDLHRHYEGVVKENLDLCYQYLNFYMGLLVAILAVTLTGILSVSPKDPRFLCLLIGPLLTLILALFGYSTLRVFYSRFVQAWVATINIEAMLGMRYTLHLHLGTYSPAYKSKKGGFLPMIERTTIESTLQTAEQEQWTAVQVVTHLFAVGDTRKNARNTFIAFILVSVVLIGAILSVVLLL